MKFGRIAKDYDPTLGETPFYRRGASGPDPLAREEFRVAQQYWQGAGQLRDQRFLKSRQFDPNVAVKAARESKLSSRFAGYWNADMRDMMGTDAGRMQALGEYGRARATLTNTGGPLRLANLGVNIEPQWLQTRRLHAPGGAGGPSAYAQVRANAVAVAQNAQARARGATLPHPQSDSYDGGVGAKLGAGAGGGLKSLTAQVREAWQERDRIHTANTGDRVNTGAKPKSSPADSMAGRSGKGGASERVNGLPPGSFATPLYGAGAGASANATPLSGVRKRSRTSPVALAMNRMSSRGQGRVDYKKLNTEGKDE